MKDTVLSNMGFLFPLINRKLEDPISAFNASPKAKYSFFKNRQKEVMERGKVITVVNFL